MAARAGFWRQFFVLALGSAALTAACSAASVNTGGSQNNGSATGGGAGTTSGTGTGSSIASSSGGGGTVVTGAGGGTIIGPGMTRPDPGKGDGPDGACAGTSASAEQTIVTKTIMTQSPVALYLVQDRSGSMKDTPAGATQDKWTQTTNALNAFVTDPKSNNLDVALGFFPIDTGMCDGTNYNMPAVPMARLPSQPQATAVANAITTNGPGGRGGGGILGGNTGNSGTPIEGALRGGENYCMVYQAQNPQEKCVVVLITDGAPNGCAMDAATLAGIAADAKMRANVMTFAIGMDGADFNLLDQIATAGGSSCGATPACNVATGTTSFSDALDKIRTTIVQTQMVVQKTKLACTYDIPTPTNGQKLDTSKVNVQITANGKAQQIGQVPSAASCGMFGNAGWYYDDPTTPKSVNFCPSTCGSVETPDGGLPVGTVAPKVDVLFGCQTVIAIPA
jgi:hypothetical protein